MSIKKNVVANYFGQGWSALMQIAFIPLYIKYLGIEAYGLIGFFSVLQAALTLVDIGITPTLNREMARYNAGAHSALTIRELLHSLEVLCISLALSIALVLWLLSDWFSVYWFQVEGLSRNSVSSALSIMGVVASLRFVESIYRGAILGLQTHVWLNAMTAFFATARSIGVVGLLMWVAPTIEAFFIWQGFISLLTVIVFARHVHGLLPKINVTPRFSMRAIMGVWSFAKGMIATTFFSLLLTHADKIILSRLLSLESFGIYMLAAAVANALMMLVSPLAQAVYPHFTEMVTKNNESRLIDAYHASSQLMSVIVVPVALILVFNGEAVIRVWSNNSLLAQQAAPLLSLLALGTAFLGLMNIPYMLQLAFGWSSFAARINAVIVVIQIPTLLWAIFRYGAIGAAWVWVAITSSYIFVVIHIMHQRLIPGEKWRWYWFDTTLPFLSALTCSILLNSLFPIPDGRLNSMIYLAISTLIMFFVTLLASPWLRKRLIKEITKWRHGDAS